MRGAKELNKDLTSLLEILVSEYHINQINFASSILMSTWYFSLGKLETLYFVT